MGKNEKLKIGTDSLNETEKISTTEITLCNTTDSGS